MKEDVRCISHRTRRDTAFSSTETVCSRNAIHRIFPPRRLNNRLGNEFSTMRQGDPAHATTTLVSKHPPPESTLPSCA
jgi:hypothetical protein